MLTLHSLVPSRIDLLFMEGKPANDDLELAARQRPGQEFTVDSNGRLILTVKNMNMRFIVTLCILE